MDILRLHFSPWKFTLISGGKNILGIIIGLCLIIYLKLGLNGYFLGNLLGLLVIVPVSLFYIKKDLCLCFKKDLAKQIIHFGYPFIFAGLAYWIFGSVDRWMLGGIADTSQVGLYSVAFKFASIIIFANMAFGQAWTPIAMKIYSEKSNYQNTFARVLTVWFFILLLGGAAICYFSREILTILTPPAYWPAVNTLNFLAMGTVIFGTTQVTVLGISLAKKTQILSFIAWFTALVNLICNFILIPRFGSVGAAIATLVSYCVLTGFYLFWSQRLNPIPIEHFKLISIIILVLCTIAISQLLNKFSLSIELFVTKVCIIVFYIIIGHFLRIINWQELKSALKGKTT
jgi:O-antigen/teichoic acid export membrane protein